MSDIDYIANQTYNGFDFFIKFLEKKLNKFEIGNAKKDSIDISKWGDNEFVEFWELKRTLSENEISVRNQGDRTPEKTNEEKLYDPTRKNNGENIASDSMQNFVLNKWLYIEQLRKENSERFLGKDLDGDGYVAKRTLEEVKQEEATLQLVQNLYISQELYCDPNLLSNEERLFQEYFIKEFKNNSKKEFINENIINLPDDKIVKSVEFKNFVKKQREEFERLKKEAIKKSKEKQIANIEGDTSFDKALNVVNEKLNEYGI